MTITDGGWDNSTWASSSIHPSPIATLLPSSTRRGAMVPCLSAHEQRLRLAVPWRLQGRCRRPPSHHVPGPRCGSAPAAHMPQRNGKQPEEQHRQQRHVDGNRRREDGVRRRAAPKRLRAQLPPLRAGRANVIVVRRCQEGRLVRIRHAGPGLREKPPVSY